MGQNSIARVAVLNQLGVLYGQTGDPIVAEGLLRSAHDQIANRRAPDKSVSLPTTISIWSQNLHEQAELYSRMEFNGKKRIRESEIAEKSSIALCGFAQKLTGRVALSLRAKRDPFPSYVPKYVLLRHLLTTRSETGSSDS